MFAVLIALSVAPVPRVQPVRMAPSLNLAALSHNDLALAQASWLKPLPVTPALTAYKLSLFDVQKNEAQAVDNAAALLAELGEDTERISVETWNGVFDGLKIKARMDQHAGGLNKLAHGVDKNLQTSIAVLPKRTAGMGGASFNAADKRITAPDLAGDEFYEGLLHETRHAWYGKLERQGDIRLFHVKAVARPGHVLVPGALAYEGYVSFEELSTFPKTLRHLASKKDKDLAINRYWHMLNIMRMGAHITEEAMARRPKITDVGDGLGIGLLRSEVYVPYTPDAEADMALRWRLLNELIGDNIQPLMDYKAAVEAEDWKKAKAASSRMVWNVKKAEKAWLAQKSR